MNNSIELTDNYINKNSSDKTAAIYAVDVLKKVLPAALAVTLVSSMVYVYLQSIVNLYSVVTLIIGCGFFALFELMRKLGKLGAIAYILLGAAVSTVEYLIASFSGGISYEAVGYYAEWFLSGGIAVQNTPEYLLMTVIGFSFFLCSSIYYFTQMVYRSSVITLISLIPCALYIKTAAATPIQYIIVIAALNLFIFIVSGRKTLEKKTDIIGRKASLTAYIDFAVAAALIAALLPKPTETPFYEKFEDYVARYSFGGSNTQLMGKYNKYSGNADDFLNMENKLIYLVNTDYPSYMTSQSFDIYNSKVYRWEASSISDNGSKDWKENMSVMSFDRLLDAYKNYPEADETFDGKVQSLSIANEPLHAAIIKAVNFPARYTIAPYRMADIEFTLGQERISYRTDAGEFFSDADYLDSDAAYSIDYYADDYAQKNGWLESGLCDISFEDYGSLLWKMKNYFDKSDDNYNTVKAFYSDYISAEHYNASDFEVPSAKICVLAKQLTSKLDYDYEKAAAIEAYFNDGTFSYDLAYKAPEDSDTPDYFIFTSKRGTCSDFATAYCLIARAAGLHVRYNEGFTYTPTKTQGLYEIFTENAHAYPQVYIAGAGWLDYEPTVPASDSGLNGDNDENGQTDYLAVILICVFALIMIMLLAAVIILAPTIAEGIFRLKAKYSKNERAVKLLYARLAVQTEKQLGIEAGALTAEQLADKVEKATLCTTDGIIKPFVRCCYGGETIDTNDKANAYKCYTEQYSLLKKYAKNFRKRKNK